MDVTDDPETFSARVLARIDAPAPAEQLRARARLASEGWRTKAARFAEILFGD
jgi:hypothetical protein